jgi:hypothetical protein
MKKITVYLAFFALVHAQVNSFSQEKPGDTLKRMASEFEYEPSDDRLLRDMDVSCLDVIVDNRAKSQKMYEQQQYVGLLGMKLKYSRPELSPARFEAYLETLLDWISKDAATGRDPNLTVLEGLHHPKVNAFAKTLLNHPRESVRIMAKRLVEQKSEQVVVPDGASSPDIPTNPVSPINFVDRCRSRLWWLLLEAS